MSISRVGSFHPRIALCRHGSTGLARPQPMQIRNGEVCSETAFRALKLGYGQPELICMR